MKREANPKKIDVTAAVILRDTKIMIARRAPGKHLAGHWEFPGGKIEPGETPEQCLKRELLEEFQIEVSVGRNIGENTHNYGDKIVRLMAYAVTHISGEFQLIDHD